MVLIFVSIKLHDPKIGVSEVNDPRQCRELDHGTFAATIRVIEQCTCIGIENEVVVAIQGFYASTT
jgi:hypothetical protein